MKYLLLLLLLSQLYLIVDSEDVESIKKRNRNDEDFIPDKIRNAIKVLPQWLKDYIKWHKETRKHHMNDVETKFLIVACHKSFACGGLSDRLRPLPYFLLAAHKTNRVLLITWQKFELEDFMVPPKGGLDWRLPKDIDIGPDRPWHQSSCKGKEGHKCELWEHDREEFQKKDLVVASREDLYSYFKDEYFTSNLRPDGVFSDIMSILFRPRLKLQREIHRTMKSLKLQPNNYLAAHFRDRYPYLIDRTARMEKDHKQHLLHNSIDCVVEKYGSKNKRIYFTSDKSKNVKYLVHESPYAMRNSTVQVVGIDEMMRDNLDEGVDFENRKPEEFFPVFVDMFLFAHSACVSYGQGGYGLFGARFAGERCMIQHQVLWNATECTSALEKKVKKKKIKNEEKKNLR